MPQNKLEIFCLDASKRQEECLEYNAGMCTRRNMKNTGMCWCVEVERGKRRNKCVDICIRECTGFINKKEKARTKGWNICKTMRDPEAVAAYNKEPENRESQRLAVKISQQRQTIY